MSEARGDRLREAAADIRSSHPSRMWKAVATLLEVEAAIRDTQPVGFYEVAEADEIAEIILQNRRDRPCGSTMAHGPHSSCPGLRAHPSTMIGGGKRGFTQ